MWNIELVISFAVQMGASCLTSRYESSFPALFEDMGYFLSVCFGYGCTFCLKHVTDTLLDLTLLQLLTLQRVNLSTSKTMSGSFME